MKTKSVFLIERTILISRRMNLLFLPFFIGVSAGLLIEFFNVNWKWLEAVASFLIGISLLVLAISWVMPGIFLLLGIPWLAHAWLQGGNPYLFPPTPWEQTHSIDKLLVYINSIIPPAAIIVVTILILRS